VFNWVLARSAACYVHLGLLEEAHQAEEQLELANAEYRDFPRCAADQAGICKRDEIEENRLKG
jgi:hypothetical protein